MKILLADDSKTIRMILKDLLVKLGVSEIQEASNGQEALDFLSADKYDVILLDIHMPQVKGLDVLKSIKTDSNSQHKETPVVIISSDTDYRQIEKARDLKAFGYIKKPFKKEGLEAAIGAARKIAARNAEAMPTNQVSAGTTPATESALPPEAKSVPAEANSASHETNSPTTTTEPQSNPASTDAKPESRGVFGWIRKIMHSK